MNVRLLLGDCVERMAAMPESSVGGIVCDPPYGLEFMGKDWDRLWDTEKPDRANDLGQSKAGFARGAPAVPGVRGEIKALPSYNARGNVRCAKCRRWKWGHKPGDGGGGGLACQCKEPDFPNVGALQSRAMAVWHTRWLEEAYRVLQCGGVLKAFGGTRTFHRLAAAMAEVGFEQIRVEAWGYGSGFPKSLNIGKALDRTHYRRALFDRIRAHLTEARARSGLSIHAVNEAFGFATGGSGVAGHWFANIEQQRIPTPEQWFRLKALLGWSDCDLDEMYGRVATGAERTVVGHSTNGIAGGTGLHAGSEGGYGFRAEFDVTAPATSEASLWEGWGTALKPAWEPVVVGRKP